MNTSLYKSALRTGGLAPRLSNLDIHFLTYYGELGNPLTGTLVHLLTILYKASSMYYTLKLYTVLYRLPDDPAKAIRNLRVWAHTKNDAAYKAKQKLNNFSIKVCKAYITF